MDTRGEKKENAITRGRPIVCIKCHADIYFDQFPPPDFLILNLIKVRHKSNLEGLTFEHEGANFLHADEEGCYTVTWACKPSSKKRLFVNTLEGAFYLRWSISWTLSRRDTAPSGILIDLFVPDIVR